jgi:hypothetical protein
MIIEDMKMFTYIVGGVTKNLEMDEDKAIEILIQEQEVELAKNKVYGFNWANDYIQNSLNDKGYPELGQFYRSQYMHVSFNDLDKLQIKDERWIKNEIELDRRRRISDFDLNKFGGTYGT